MIHKTTDGLYVISSGGVWMPGTYDSRDTAALAESIAIEGYYKELSTLQKSLNPGGIITMFLLINTFSTEITSKAQERARRPYEQPHSDG